jgi:heme A synthase
LSHLLLMVLYAALLGAFFAALWKRQRREQVVLFLQVFLGLVGGAVLLGWAMYFLPTGPPSPFP